MWSFRAGGDLMDWPVPITPTMPMIFSWSSEALGCLMSTLASSQITSEVSTSYPAANRILYIPFSLGRTVVVAQMFVYNGAFTGGPNINLGIYSQSGTRLVETGTTAQTGTSSLQVIDITDTTIGPGSFYLAVIATATTANMFMINFTNAEFARAAGLFQEAGTGSTLPTTATFSSTTSSVVPMFGFTTRSEVVSF